MISHNCEDSEIALIIINRGSELCGIVAQVLEEHHKNIQAVLYLQGKKRWIHNNDIIDVMQRDTRVAATCLIDLSRHSVSVRAHHG